MNGPVDVYGNLLKPGDFVVYGHGDRVDALQFGFIEKIDETYDTDWQGNTRVNYHVWTIKTDAHRTIEYTTLYDEVEERYVPTDKPKRSGKLNYRKARFMKMP